MFSEMARQDLKALRQQGFNPTDEDVVKLNDLGVQIECGKETTIMNHPRLAMAGNVVFHEPTVGSDIWWWEYGRDASLTVKGKLRTHFFMLAHARDVELLNGLKHPRDINRAVRMWLKGVGATDDEMLRAMMYVKHGVNWILPDDATDEPSDDENLDWLETLLGLAVSTLGIPPSSLNTQTKTQLIQMVRMSSKMGMTVKPSIAKLYIAYQQLVKEIEEREKRN